MIFNGEMVRAILDGRKTQTRRPVNRSTANLLDLQAQYPHKKYNISCPCGAVGDRLWVRETWAEAGASAPELTLYRANYPAHVQTHYENVPPAEDVRWKPSIHMPRWASRILLEITDVRVEQVQSISQADAIAEGAPRSHPSIDAVSQQHGFPDFSRSWFCQTWQSIYGAECWQTNPWVWVIEFKVAPNVPTNSTGSDLC